MIITKTGKVTILEDEILIEKFTFTDNDSKSSASEEAIIWAINQLEKVLRGEPLKQS